MTWIGGQAGGSAHEAAEGLGAAQKTTEGAAGAAKGGVESSTGAVQKGAEKRGENKKEESSSTIT